MDLKSKTAIVTGGNRGIGNAIALALAEKGVNIAVIYHSDRNEANDTVEEIRQYDVKATSVQTDVQDISQVTQMRNKVVEELDAIDFLVNNAGISGEHSKLEEISEHEWRKVVDVNLTGVFNCCKVCEKELRKNKGKIVNISSIAGKMGGTIGCHYGASKAGVIGLTFALANELAPYVMVNAVAPGPVDTDLLSPQVKKKLSDQTPFGRIAKPEEIAHTVVYLLENDYVSGEVVDVNAGRYMD